MDEGNTLLSLHRIQFTGCHPIRPKPDGRMIVDLFQRQSEYDVGRSSRFTSLGWPSDIWCTLTESKSPPALKLAIESRTQAPRTCVYAASVALQIRFNVAAVLSPRSDLRLQTGLDWTDCARSSPVRGLGEQPRCSPVRSAAAPRLDRAAVDCSRLVFFFGEGCCEHDMCLPPTKKRARCPMSWESPMSVFKTIRIVFL
jgi:hypothetical protein